MTQKPPSLPPPTVSNLEFGDAFIATISGDSTADTYRYALGHVARFVSEMGSGGHSVFDFQANVLKKFFEWMKAQEFARATIDKTLSAFRRYLEWLDADDHIKFSLSKAESKLKAARRKLKPSKSGREPDPGIPRIVTYYDGQPLPQGDTYNIKQQRFKLLRARAIVHTLYASAGRVSEVASLTRDAVLDGKLSEVRITGKGGKDRMLLLTEDAQRAIAAYCRARGDDGHDGLFISHGRGAGRTLARGTLWAVVKEAANALGLYKGTSPHAFRHFRAQQLLHEGMDLDVLQSYLGHADIGTTRAVYAPHTNKEKLRDQLATFGVSAREAADSDLQP